MFEASAQKDYRRTNIYDGKSGKWVSPDFRRQPSSVKDSTEFEEWTKETNNRWNYVMFPKELLFTKGDS